MQSVCVLGGECDGKDFLGVKFSRTRWLWTSWFRTSQMIHLFCKDLLWPRVRMFLQLILTDKAASLLWFSGEWPYKEALGDSAPSWWFQRARRTGKWSLDLALSWIFSIKKNL